MLQAGDGRLREGLLIYSMLCCLKHFYKMDLQGKCFDTCLTSNCRKVCSKFIIKN